MKRERVEEIYRRVSVGYDAATSVLERLQFNQLRRNLLERATGRVLEVAVGTGKNLPYYSNACEITGLDLSRDMLSRAERRAKEHGVSFRAVQADAMALPFVSHSFDTVVCTLGSCTFPDAAAVMREMQRVCSSEGRVLLLEHTRVEHPVGGRLLDALTPLSERLLGCRANHDLMASFLSSGLGLVSRTEALRGFLLAIEARPQHSTDHDASGTSMRSTEAPELVQSA